MRLCVAWVGEGKAGGRPKWEQGGETGNAQQAVMAPSPLLWGRGRAELGAHGPHRTQPYCFLGAVWTGCSHRWQKGVVNAP